MFPINISDQWFKLRNSFEQLERIQISCWIRTPGKYVTLIEFSDALEEAYAAAILSQIEERK